MPLRTPPQSIIFVVDGKKLEAMSLILATSLARHHAVGRDVDLIAYVSGTTLDTLNPATRAIYAALGVKTAVLPSARGMWRVDYPHGNKILACAAPRASQRTTFLDTDMLCQAPITDIAAESPHEVFVVPEGVRTWGKNPADWHKAYAFCDLPLPTGRVTLTRGNRTEFYPYFNAGFISFSDLPLADDGSSFGQLWLNTARRFDYACDVANKRPWLDQITLPLVMAEHALDCLVLPDTYNYSISARDSLSALPLAKMVHYHRAGYFGTMPQARALMDQLRDQTPARLRDDLDLLMAVHFDPFAVVAA